MGRLLLVVSWFPPPPPPCCVAAKGRFSVFPSLLLPLLVPVLVVAALVTGGCDCLMPPSLAEADASFRGYMMRLVNVMIKQD